ncbi:MAG: DUF983 domain-containing protein [Variibacter sp.]
MPPDDPTIHNPATLDAATLDSATLGACFSRGLRGRCPRCGEGAVFQGFLNVRPRCERCGLDFAFADSADGPAVFVILFAGFIVAASALITEVLYQPPLWVHALLWLPLAIVVCVGPLRPLKGLMIALQYHFQAAEGRLQRREGA